LYLVPQTIENVILSFEPCRVLSVRVAKAPENFPFPNAIRQTQAQHEPVHRGRADSRPVDWTVSEHVLEKRADVADARHARGRRCATYLSQIPLVQRDLRVDWRERRHLLGQLGTRVPEMSESGTILVDRAPTALNAATARQMLFQEHRNVPRHDRADVG
jgi:hypothetical protein